MKVCDQHWLPISREKTWEMLNTPWVLQRCIKGCESVVQTDDRHFYMTFKIKVGLFRKRFQVQVEIADRQPNQSYVLMANMEAGVAGKVDGETRVVLSEEEGQTRLRYDAKITVSGWFSQFGEGLLEAAAKRYMNRFIDQLVVIASETPS